MLFFLLAVQCPADQIFKECSDRCHLTCVDLQSKIKKCTKKCVEGCECPIGMALDASNKCIPIEMCPKESEPTGASTKSMTPTEPTELDQDAEPTESTVPDEPDTLSTPPMSPNLIRSTTPTTPDQTTKPVKRPTKPTRTTRPTKSSKPTTFTKPTKPTEPSDVDDGTEPSESNNDEVSEQPKNSNNTTKQPKTTRPTKPNKTTKPTESTEETSPTEPSEPSDNKVSIDENVEANTANVFEPNETPEVTEPSEINEAPETNDDDESQSKENQNKLENEECSDEKNQRMSICIPDEPKTCANMNNYNSKPTGKCRKGCVCKNGYVFDEELKQCVMPNFCSCEDKGKHYIFGAQIENGCKACICHGGEWYCRNTCKSKKDNLENNPDTNVNNEDASVESDASVEQDDDVELLPKENNTPQKPQRNNKRKNRENNSKI